jgi:signal transduction histidine kinase
METENGEIIFFVVFTSIVLVLLVLLVINLLLIGRNRKLKHDNEVLKLKTEYEQALTQTQVEVAEQTLNDIARDLHDDISQQLTFSIMQLDSLSDSLTGNEQKQAEEASDIVRQSLQSVRSISHSLSSDYIQSFGIYPSLHRLVERINKQQRIICELNFSKLVLFKNKPNEIFAFRILQELITNTLKYAQAKNITIAVVEINDTIIISYADDGKGMNINTTNPTMGVGFLNMKKRADLLLGKIEIKSELGKGFSARLEFTNV